MPTDDANRPLPVLRAMVDAIDRDVLQLLARRTALVGEIGAYKREHGLAIRDVGREREVLAERLARAEELGLPGGVVESIWRQVLVASRDHQAALRSEVPLSEPSRTVAVIGGEGGMGKLLRRLFADLGHAVLNVDLRTELSAVEAAKVADVVVVSVPIRDTEAVIREVGPVLSKDALLMDVTSLKSAPLAAMLEATEASVVGTHPMFGPGVHTLQGQRVVVCAGRGEEWLAWVKRSLGARGLEVVEAQPADHDRVMALVQVLNHFRTQVLGLTLARSGLPLDRSLAFTSPAYLLEAYVTARHFAQAPALYGPIEMLNPHQAEVTELFRACAEEIAGILARGDQPAFDALFDEVGDFFGDFTEEALEQSRFLVDRLVELTAGRASASSSAASTEKST
ncbi:MAG: bifunctional chorismate mutase/prephenate dehydrogenase [Deltaproteobacteria bacterium]|nr:bifunctional chorismate mutase/prephenate dehydrogenase [Deltaproteobacteria bacterium]